MSAQCKVCGEWSPLTAEVLSVCERCVRQQPHAACTHLEEAHAASRREFDLPLTPPRTRSGVVCPLCANACRLGEGEVGFCGLRTARADPDTGRLRLEHLAGTARGAMVSWYDDGLPTNCVGSWVCAGGRQRRPWVNLAVFYEACTFNCLFCQNWHFRLRRPSPGRLVSAERLAAQAHRHTYCVCYFGGDPTAQLPHALTTSRILARQGVRVCWETNGSMHPRLLDQALRLSLETGGCIKVDLKAWDDTLHRALTGVSNRRTLETIERIAGHLHERPDPPLLVVSTLLVPGYVTASQVGQMAGFLASLDPEIPYSLLGFHPHFFMPDLPRTSVRHADEAEAAARAAGLTRVRIGNRHLLSRAY
jgi:pyruvate formate lyase activating enzyme